jgi:hypothetical protein
MKAQGFIPNAQHPEGWMNDSSNSLPKTSPALDF